MADRTVTKIIVANLVVRDRKLI